MENSRPLRFPPNFFGFGFGLAGLTEAWLVAAHGQVALTLVGDALAALSGLAWLTVLVGYLRYAVADRSVLRRDLMDPVAAPFLSLAVITPMFLAVLGVVPHARRTGIVTFDVFLVLTVLLGGWFTGQWIYGSLDIDRFHPGYFLPTVAGGLIGSDGAAVVGQHQLSELMLGFGVLSWLVTGSIILGRLYLRPMLPTPLIPTLAIEVAPAAVASLAWFDTHGDHIDAVILFLAGYGLLMMLAQLRLLPIYLRLPFMPSTWAFTFSWSAVASAVIHWLQAAQPAAYRTEQYLILAAITLLVVGIAARTLLAIKRHELNPPAPAALEATVSAASTDRILV